MNFPKVTFAAAFSTRLGRIFRPSPILLSLVLTVLILAVLTLLILSVLTVLILTVLLILLVLIILFGHYIFLLE